MLGLTSTAFLTGKAFAASFSFTPALLEAPAPLLARQWKKQFDSDKYVAPAIALFSSGVFSYIAYRNDAWTKPSILYTTSASLLLALLPYTFFISDPVNRQLESKAQSLALTATEDGVPQEETTHALVDKWATINLGKVLIAGISALVATWAAVEREEIVPATFSFSTGANRF